MARLLVTTITVSIFGAATTASGSGIVNTKPGQITNEELRAFFYDNRELLQDIATQLIQLREELNLDTSINISSNVVALDGTAKPVTLGAQLTQLLQQYFNAIGTANTPVISVYEAYREFILVTFAFHLTDGRKGIMYVTLLSGAHGDDDSLGIEQLDENWHIFQEYMGSPLVAPWWQKLPAWLQLILRYVCFGWIWMK